MDLMCRNKDLAVQICSRRVNFVSKMWMARNKEEDDLRSRVWNNCLRRSEYPYSQQMAIKMPCKLKHEIERGLSKECGK